MNIVVFAISVGVIALLAVVAIYVLFKPLITREDLLNNPSPRPRPKAPKRIDGVIGESIEWYQK